MMAGHYDITVVVSGVSGDRNLIECFFSHSPEEKLSKSINEWVTYLRCTKLRFQFTSDHSVDNYELCNKYAEILGEEFFKSPS